MPLVIAGPTGSGKSSLAIKLALAHKGEIICADSRQCYQFMSIGSACPSVEDKKRVVHHGYEMLDPRHEKMSTGFFVEWVKKTSLAIQEKGKRPIIVGGTGLYLRALRYGVIYIPHRNEEIIKKLEEECERLGLASMYKKLSLIDSESALNIMPNDKLRILRALEIYSLTQEKPSKLRQSFKNKKPIFKAHWLLLKPQRDTLKENLKKRVEAMFAQGLIEEAIHLKTILPLGHWALETMGFKEAILYSENKITLEEAMEQTLIKHRQYAKRQFTWFNKEDFYKVINICS